MDFSAARDVLRMVGPARAIFDVAPWLVRRRYIFYALTLPVADRPASRDVRFEPATERDLPLMARMRPGMYRLPELHRRLRDGHLAFIARRNEAVVHIRWVFTGPVYVPYLRRRVAVEGGDVLLDEIFTPPAWRRQGVEAAVAVAMPRMLHEMGYQRILAVVASWNLAPQRVAASHGYERLGSCAYWALGGPRRHVWEGAVAERGDGVVVIGRRAPAGREPAPVVVQ